MSPAAVISANNPATTTWGHPVTRWLFLVLIATLAWDTSGRDLPFMQWIGSPTGFPLQHQWWLEGVLHEGWRQLFVAFYLLMGVWAMWPSRWNLPPLAAMVLPRRERVALLLLVALSLLAINLIKYSSLTSCPWDLELFGGSARYVSHWDLWQADGGPGRCFPGGHASSALAFLGLCLPWLAPPGKATRDPEPGLRWLMGLLMAGLVAGAAQTLRGAHFPSHTLWTLLICGSVSWAGWLAARPWMAKA